MKYIQGKQSNYLKQWFFGMYMFHRQTHTNQVFRYKQPYEAYTGLAAKLHNTAVLGTYEYYRQEHMDQVLRMRHILYTGLPVKPQKQWVHTHASQTKAHESGIAGESNHMKHRQVGQSNLTKQLFICFRQRQVSQPSYRNSNL